MNNPTWPKVFAFIGLSIFGATLAYYSTAIVTAGIAGGLLGMDRNGDTVTSGSAVLLTGMAMATVFAFLALLQARKLLGFLAEDPRRR